MKRPITLGLFLTVLITIQNPAPAVAVDATIVHETVVSGYDLASGRGVIADARGNAYAYGRYTGDHGQSNILFVKLDPDGQEVWARVIAGAGHDYATGMQLDGQGGLVVAGWTDSDDFPTTQGPIGGIKFRDAFVMKLDTDDGTTVWSTKIGGDYTDGAYGMALNEAGEIILVGQTGSTDFPTTPDAYQGEPSAPLYIYTDVFIMRLDAQARSVLYSTYCGGFADEYPLGMDLAPDGGIVFAGRTTSDDFPLARPFQSAPQSIFVARMSADGRSLEFGSYLGGSDVDVPRGVAAGPDGHIYLAGSTRSVDFPTTPDAFQPDFIGGINDCEEGFPGHPVNCEDGWVVRLDPTTGSLVYGTFLAGSLIDEARGVDVDQSGAACVVGFAGAADFPGGPTAFSVYLARLNAAGDALDYSVFTPSNSGNAGHGVFAASTLDAYFTAAVNVPADLYVARVAADAAAGATQPAVPGAGIRLLPNSPNPFNPSTTIAFELPRAAAVTLRILDPAGRVVRTLLAEDMRPAGRNEVSWRGDLDDGGQAASGVYLYRLEADGQARSGRMALLK
jgi:hypothetical protein